MKLLSISTALTFAVLQLKLNPTHANHAKSMNNILQGAEEEDIGNTSKILEHGPKPVRNKVVVGMQDESTNKDSFQKTDDEESSTGQGFRQLYGGAGGGGGSSPYCSGEGGYCYHRYDCCHGMRCDDPYTTNGKCTRTTRRMKSIDSMADISKIE